MAQITVICSNEDLGVTEDGAQIHIVLDDDYVGLAAKAGQIRSTLVKVTKTQVDSIEVEQQVYDPCKGCTVTICKKVPVYQWQYTLSYEDDETVPPGTLITQSQVKSLSAVTGVDEYQNACIADITPGSGPQGIYSQLIYGAGSDGDRTVTGNETLGDVSSSLPTARPYFYNNLTIDAGAVLELVGNMGSSPDNKQEIQLFVNGTLTVNGTIAANGADGDAAALGVGGFGAAVQAEAGPGGWSDGGADGGSVPAGAAGGLAQNSANLSTGSGWRAGGVGGSGGTGGGAGGAGTPTVVGSDFDTPYVVDRWLPNLTDFGSGGSFIQNVIGGGTGGGAGGAGETANGGGGGGGGGGGRCIYIAARNIVVNGTGVIQANGGAGGDGADATADPGDGGGAGGGGGGGLVFIVTQNLANTGTIEATAGAAGSAGAGLGAGAAGGAAGAATDGKVVVLNTLAGTVTIS